MTADRSLRRWVFFLGVTFILAVPLAVTYFIASHKLRQWEREQHQNQVDNQLNQWQEQLNDLKWDGQADTTDDLMHLGRYDENRLLRETMRWYVFPDGRCFYEGMAVLEADGRSRPSRVVGLLDDQGRMLEGQKRREILEKQPWLEEPWLPDYGFAVKALNDDPEVDFYFSPFIKIKDRLVFVMASPRRDAQGRVEVAVMAQMAVADVFQVHIKPAVKGLSLWLLDRSGALGLATTPLAEKSALDFAKSPALKSALAAGREIAEKSASGAAGSREQTLDDHRIQLSFRTVADHLVIGVAEEEASLGQIGAGTIRLLAGLTLISLILLSLAGAVYTVAASRQEARLVEATTLRRYAGTMSHQLRNELTVVRGLLELFFSRAAGPDSAREEIGPAIEKSLADIETTLTQLEALAQGDCTPVYEGQAGQETLYRLKHKEPKEGRP